MNDYWMKHMSNICLKGWRGLNKWRRRRERSKRGTEGERRKRKRRRTRRRSRVKKRTISGRNVIGGSSGLVLVLVAANLCNAKCSNHQRLLLRAADTAMNNELVPFYLFIFAILTFLVFLFAILTFLVLLFAILTFSLSTWSRVVWQTVLIWRTGYQVFVSSSSFRILLNYQSNN